MSGGAYHFDEIYATAKAGLEELLVSYVDAHQLNAVETCLIRKAVEARLIRFKNSCKKWPDISPNGFTTTLLRSVQILFYFQIKVTPMCFLEAMQYADDILPRLNCELVAGGYRPTDTWEIMEICGKLKTINKSVR